MTVLVVAQSHTVIAQVEAKLRGSGEWRVACGLLSQATTLVDRHHPHVIVLAHSRARLTRALDLMRHHTVGLPIVLLLDEVDEGWTSQIRRAGVRAVMPLDASADELTAALRAVGKGLVVLHPHALATAAAAPRPDTALTPRELEIVDMMAEGLSNEAIAHRLGISRHTVKFHVASVLAKLRASSRTKAVMLAVRRGLVRV